MDIENLTIAQAREIASIFSGMTQHSTSRLAPDGEIRIAVLQRGHVVIGVYSQTGNIGRLEKASVIRRWGTSKGLGELAMSGPLSENEKNGPTILDACPPVSFHVREVIMMMEVNKDAWGILFN